MNKLNKISVCTEYDINNKDILKDLWVLRYSENHVRHRCELYKDTGNLEIKTWAIRCQLRIIVRYVTLTEYFSIFTFYINYTLYINYLMFLKLIVHNFITLSKLGLKYYICHSCFSIVFLTYILYFLNIKKKIFAQISICT